MRPGSRFIDAITERRRAVIAVMLVVTLVLSGGVAALEQSSSLDQFKSDGPETDRLEYAEENFGADGDTTTAQLFVRDDNVLSKESLIATLELQRDIREDETVEPTLVDDPIDDLSTVVATAAIREERADDLREREARLEDDRAELEATAEELVDLLDEARELQTEYDELNAAHEAGEIDDEEYEDEAERIEGEFEAVDERAEATLTDEQYAAFEPVLEETREHQSELFGVEAAYERGEIDADERDERAEELGDELEASYAAIEEEVLAAELDALEERADELEADADELEELDPTLDEQIEQLESMEESEIEELLEAVLDGEDDGRSEALVFLPTDYEPGSTEADARLLFVTQATDGQQVIDGEASEEIVESQLAMDAMVEERFAEGFVFGEGIATDEIDRSLVDSLALVLPFSLLFVCLVLTVAYRDPLDILLGLVGIVVVLLWTLGFMGWAGIPFTQIMVAVPALLVGLSIDYAIHVFMRHRERRGEGEDASAIAMRTVLGGLGVALVWVTTTAAFGFLSNLVSPVEPIREFGLVSAVGIVAALLVFGALIPAAKVELDALLEARGVDRRRRAFGTDGAFAGLLSGGERVAHRAPWAVVVAVLLVTAAGAYGAVGVDTTFEQEDFIADDPPAWMASLPGPLATGEYGAKANLATLNEQAARQDTRTQVVVTGDVADDRTLERVDAAHDLAADRETTVALADGDADVRDPLSTMRAVASENESFEGTFEAADTTGDGVPDRDVASVYDALFEADEERAREVIHRTDDGEYEAVRMVITVQGDVASGAVTDDARGVASALDGDGLEATATGQPVVFSVVEEELFETVIQSLALTLGAVAVLLALVYRRTVGSATLGLVTLAPIVCSVAWIVGTMSVLGVPFNAITGTITSLTVGLGVAYNIHMAERYLLERRHGNDPREALRRSVRGTGGALLGSAATTVGGFGVLAFAILPPLQQFGLITGLTIVYAFVGSVFVLPSLLVLWTRYVGPAGGPSVGRSVGGEGETTVADGGWE